jgi:predicted metalloprotease with PDZ domain
MAPFDRAAFEAGGVPHYVTISGRHDADLDRLAADLARICRWHCELFGDAPDSKPPFAQYLFQVNAVGDGYGGLEHRSSTSLLCSRDELPRRGATAIDEGYRSFLGLASHEYFHAWHVKRIRPAAFMSGDLSCERYTRLLWAFEGFTSYYDDLALVRSGVIEVASYLELAGRTITSVLRTPGRTLQSVAESSFDAWIKYYRQDEDTPNAVVSYYAKGAVVALALDLTLRRHRSSLDELMRTLWRRFGRTGVGVPEDGIHALASELANVDLSAFFAHCVDGTADPPLAELLADVGVTLDLRAAEGANDRGGRKGKADAPRASLGVKLASGEAKLVHAFRDGAAARAGLAAGDVIVAADGLKMSADALTARIARGTPGERIVLHAFRRDELMSVEATLDEPPLDTCFLTLDEGAAEIAQRKRREWLGR